MPAGDPAYVVGVDFGALSGRAVVVGDDTDVATLERELAWEDAARRMGVT